jgi:hypothetical protein
MKTKPPFSWSLRVSMRASLGIQGQSSNALRERRPALFSGVEEKQSLATFCLHGIHLSWSQPYRKREDTIHIGK